MVIFDNVPTRRKSKTKFFVPAELQGSSPNKSKCQFVHCNYTIVA